MPELPEVETVARDLRPLLLGATITGARCPWARTLKTHDGDDSARRSTDGESSVSGGARSSSSSTVR